MASMNVSVPDPMRDWVQRRIESGQYATVSDYVRDLIRRDQARADEQNALIAALIEGEQSGVSKRSVPEILAAVKKELRSRLHRHRRRFGGLRGRRAAQRNRKHRVLLLEAGPKDTNPWIHMPLGYTKTFANPKVNWMFESEPEPD
jgi:antitoxin ParD1/3/4